MANIEKKRDGFFLPLERQMSRLLSDFFGEYPTAKMPEMNWMPLLDVAETEDEVIVKAEIPGVEPGEVDITLQGDTLVLKGEKKEEREEKKKNFHHVERRYGSFYRSIGLPAMVQADKVKAESKDGTLTITLPKKEEEKAKSIKVNVNK